MKMTSPPRIQRDSYRAGRRELSCPACGYGIVLDRKPERCPMCGGGQWQIAGWHLIDRASPAYESVFGSVATGRL